MLYIIFQFLDFLTAIVVAGAHYNLISWKLLIYHAIYLILKGVIYWRSWMSWIDIIVGIYIILMIFGLHGWMTWISICYFVYKALSTLAN